MAVNLLATQGYTNTANTSTSPSFTPTANSLLIVLMFLHNSGSTDPGDVSCAVASGLSGQGSFTMRKEAQLNANSTTILTSQTGASPTAGTVTCSWTNSRTRRYMVVLEVTGHDTASPIGADGANAATSGLGVTVTMSATPAATSTVIAAVCQGSTVDTGIGLDADYTELHEGNSGGASQQCYTMTGYDLASADGTIEFTSMSDGAAKPAVALEIKMASSGTTVSEINQAQVIDPVSLAAYGEFTYTDGYGGNVNTATDLLISAGWPTFNGGQHESFDLDPNNPQHALLRFNLEAIPADATCLGATLYLYRDQGGEGGGTCAGNVYSIAAANSGWVEGTKNIALAGAGEPCWNARQADGSGGVTSAWAGSAGCSTSGTDYEATSIGSYSFLPADDAGTEIAISLSTTRIKDWFGPSNTNYGIILITTAGSNNAHVGSSESATTGYRPKLVVNYSTTGNYLIVSDIVQTEIVDTISIGVTHPLAGDDVNQSSVVDAVLLGAIHTVAVLDINQSQVVDAVGISFGVQLDVSPQDINQSQTVDDVTIGALHGASASEISQLQIIDVVTVSVTHPVTASEINQAQTIDAVTVTFSTIGSVTLAGSELNQAQIIDAILISVSHPVAVLDVNQAQVIDAVSLTAEGPTSGLVVLDVNQGQTVDLVTIGVVHVISASEIFQAQAIDPVTLVLAALVLHGARRIYQPKTRASHEATSRGKYRVPTRGSEDVDD